ncbi:SCO2584 family spore wall biosynthesis protein [Streptomyces sp. NPDC003327]
MPDDVGGTPFPDGADPEDSVDRGGADEDYAAVVFDEDFVRAAPVHEPTAVERLLAAAQARAEAESARARAGGGSVDDDPYEDGYDPAGLTYEPDDIGDDDSPYGRHGGALRPYRGRARWHRPVAWILALLMGIGMVALAFAAVYRGAAANRQDQVPPPATTGVDKPTPNPAPPAADGPSVRVPVGHEPPPSTATATPSAAPAPAPPPATALPGTP